MAKTPQVRRRLFFDSAESSKSKSRIIKIESSGSKSHSSKEKETQKIKKFGGMRRRNGFTIKKTSSTKAKVFFEEVERKGLKAVKSFLNNHRGDQLIRRFEDIEEKGSGKKKGSKERGILGSKKKSGSRSSNGKSASMKKLRQFRPLNQTEEDESDSSSSSEDSDDFDPIEVIQYNQSCLINPEGDFKILWDTIVAVFVVYSFLVTPFKLSFVPDNHYIFWDFFDDFGVGLIFLIDMIMNFVTPIYIDYQLVISQKKIIFNYLKFWFWLDFLSVFPFEFFLDFFTEDDLSQDYSVISKAATLPKLWRLFRIARLLRTLKIKKKEDTFLGKIFKILVKNQTLMISIVPFYILNVVIAHIFASIWHSIGHFEQENSWITTSGYINEPFFDRYVASFYYIYSTVTTTGYGDITPSTIYEYILTILTQIIGVIFYSMTYNKIFRNIELHKQRDDLVEEKKVYLNELTALGFLKGEVGKRYKRKLLRMLEEEKSGFKKGGKKKPDFSGIEQKHSDQLKLEVAQSKYRFNQIGFFEGTSDKFKIHFFDNMEKFTYRRGDIIYERGSLADAFYIIVSGKVWYLMREEEIEDQYLPSDSESEELELGSRKSDGEVEQVEVEYSKKMTKRNLSIEKTDVKRKRRPIDRIFDQNSETKSIKSREDDGVFYYKGYRSYKRQETGRKKRRKARRKKVKNLPFFEVSSYFGEIELLKKNPKRNYTVVAPCKTVIYSIPKSAFKELFCIELNHIDFFVKNLEMRIRNMKRAYNSTKDEIRKLREKNLKQRGSFIKKRLKNNLRKVFFGPRGRSRRPKDKFRTVIDSVKPSDKSKNSYFRGGRRQFDVEKEANGMQMGRFSQV